ncbi:MULTISPECIES: YIP1 family protein [unclassified Myxococcus]|uniref:YIP1 family protein n=1 Tax=unclassified Myxococcus TaxID=2648731 RepID=UPI00157A9317|nr:MULTISPECIES: YIP1 family protein [unclassified Myxococcus]NTX37248.1 YIP1 family protein [Myxococcus sp. CA033]NTX53642.1 YIP1 family protein [Myxococcus sp. CA039A]
MPLVSGIPCPFCQASFAPGAQRCPACGASLLVAPPADSDVAVCAIHPEWMSFHACTRCGAFACSQCLREGPRGELVCARCHERSPHEPLPWDQREELGWAKAFWKTCVEVMLRPGVTFGRMSPEGSVGSSLLFALLTAFVGYFVTSLFYFAVLLVVPYENLASRAMGEPGPSFFRGLVVFFFFGWVVVMPVLSMVITVVASALDHVVLRLAGAPSTFAATLRGHALSQGVYLLGLVPFCGMYVMPFWSAGVRVAAYQKLYRVGWGQAALGALLVPVLSCCLGVGGYAAMMMSLVKSP